MTTLLDGQPKILRRRHDEAILSILTILLIFLMFVIAPLVGTGSVIAPGLGLLTSIALIAGAAIVSRSRIAFALLSLAIILNAIVVYHRLTGQKPDLDLHLIATAWLIFSVTLAWVVAKAVFGLGRVSYHRIVGAVLLYLLIALAFSALYIFIGIAFPKAFSGISFVDSPELTGTLFYFSFVTLTSTGYGDMFPVHPIARSVCNLETILGQLYPATLLARLVTLELQDRQS